MHHEEDGICIAASKPTQEDINKLATQLKSLSVIVWAWTDEYSVVAMDVNDSDSTERVCSNMFRRAEQATIVHKQKKSYTRLLHSHSSKN